MNSAGARVQKLLLHHDCVTSALVSVEICSALSQRVSERVLDVSRVSEILERVAGDRAYWTILAVGADVLRDAEALASAHDLSTGGAVHLASAKLFAARLSAPDLVFVSADEARTE